MAAVSPGIDAASIQAALLEPDPERKARLATALWQRCSAGASVQNPAAAGLPSVAEPGRPARPRLVLPRDLPRRSLNSDAGKAAFVHAIAHIEFNAINLALDAACRFGDMPADFYSDWLSVAADEARHFGWLRARLQTLAADYGEFDAHDGLWEMATKTADDVLARMALVPRVLEARGLDVTPGMIRRLTQLGDTQTVAILEQILIEEVPHVAVGTRWFHWCCAQQNLPADETFQRLIAKHLRGRIKPPFNEPARLAAGFSAGELAALGEL